MHFSNFFPLWKYDTLLNLNSRAQWLNLIFFAAHGKMHHTKNLRIFDYLPGLPTFKGIQSGVRACRDWFSTRHNRNLAKSIQSKDRTRENLIVQASPWYVDPCSSGLALLELKKNFAHGPQGGPHWSNFFTVVPPLIQRLNFFFSSWKSRPLQHGSTHHMEAWTIKLSHVLTFD